MWGVKPSFELHLWGRTLLEMGPRLEVLGERKELQRSLRGKVGE